jgi:hypothetical protein
VNAVAKPKLTFEAWRAAVNAAVESQVGLSLDDLADAPLADWFEDGVTPTSAAKRAIYRSWRDGGQQE